MIQTHKLVIIPVDGAVVTDQRAITDLDLSSCLVPNNIHALQWNNPVWQDDEKTHLNGLQYGQGTGWLELRSNDPNVTINELPQWAINCYNVWLEKYNEQLTNEAAEAAEIAAAHEAHENNNT